MGSKRRTRQRSVLPCPLLAGLLALTFLLVGAREAHAVRGQDDLSWVRLGPAELEVDLQDLALFSGLETGSPADIATRQWKLPLIPPSWLIGTPAAPDSDLGCLSLLTAEGVIYQEARPTEGIATPVQFPNNVIGGVHYKYYFPGRIPRVIDCRLGLALARAAPVLKANGVSEVIYLNHYRPSYGQIKRGHYNFHSQGLAIDIRGFRVGRRTKLIVERDYEPGLGFQDSNSCLGRPMTMKGMLLRKIVCDLDEADVFEAILTPDFDAGHWNHFHISAFHLEQRTRVRPRGTALMEVPITDLTSWAIRRSIRQRPALRKWDDVAVRPWPKRYRWIQKKLGISTGPSPAELAADLLQGQGQEPGPVGRIWNALVGLLDQVPPDVSELLEQVFEPTLESPFWGEAEAPADLPPVTPGDREPAPTASRP